MRDVRIPLQDIHSPQAGISLTQLITICQNALRLSTDRHLLYRIGASIHVSTYGMYGYALLCCPDFRKAMDFAMRHHALAAPLATIDFREDKADARWVIEPNLHAMGDSALYRFVTEMQIGIHISLMRDIMGPTFAPSEITLTYPQASDFELPRNHIGCPVRFRPAGQSDCLPVKMAGSTCRPRQQDDVSDHCRPVRRLARRPDVTDRDRREDSYRPAPRHREPSDL
ncbi:AraC family transcriptional regulator [Bradyrhizobium sp. Pear76]|nr:AraC family transcriptional regulator [Bradyrhizobium oropedii]